MLDINEDNLQILSLLTPPLFLSLLYLAFNDCPTFNNCITKLAKSVRV